MESKYCDWCSEPVEQGQELCLKCLAAQRQVEQGMAVAPQPARTDIKKASDFTVKGVLIAVVKGVAATILAFGMVGAGLAGTCAVLIGAMGYWPALGGGVVALAIAALLGWAIVRMYSTKPPAQKREPRSLEDRSDSLE